MVSSQKERQQYALQTIFSFFLGLMVLAFIGIGVNTFYPEPPYSWENPQVRELENEMRRIEMRTYEEGGAAEDDRLAEIQKEIEEINRGDQALREEWSRNTSIVLILFATLVMGVSLVRSEQLRVISNGLLLGGLFTMLYGVGWSIASGDSYARFGVIVFALAVTLALGYLRFVRGREAAVAGTTGRGGSAAVAAAAGTPVAFDDHAVASLVERIDALERRTAAAAAALRTGTESRGEES